VISGRDATQGLNDEQPQNYASDDGNVLDVLDSFTQRSRLSTCLQAEPGHAKRTLPGPEGKAFTCYLCKTYLPGKHVCVIVDVMEALWVQQLCS